MSRRPWTRPVNGFLDHHGDLFYIPLPGEDLTKAEVVVPVATEQVRMAGDPQQGRYVEHITLKGLSFQHTRCPVPPQGHNDGQAAVDMPSTITADGTRHVTIENDEVTHVGGYAIWFRRGCEDCRVRHCLIHDLGAGGVRVGQGVVDNDKVPPAPTLPAIALSTTTSSAPAGCWISARWACGSATAPTTR